MQISMHNVKTIRVGHYYPSNANSIAIKIEANVPGSDCLELILYNLDTDTTDKLQAAFSDEKTLQFPIKSTS